MDTDNKFDLEHRIIFEDKCLVTSWSTMLKEKEYYVKCLVKELFPFLGDVSKIKVGYFGFKDGKCADRIEDGCLTISPATTSIEDEIVNISGIGADEKINNISVCKYGCEFDYKRQRVIIYFNYRESTPYNF